MCIRDRTVGMRFPKESSARRPTMTVDPDPSVLSTYPSAMRFAWPTGHPASAFGARLERKGAPPGDQRGWPPVQPVEDLPQVLGASPVPAPAVAGEPAGAGVAAVHAALVGVPSRTS